MRVARNFDRELPRSGRDGADRGRSGRSGRMGQCGTGQWVLSRHPGCVPSFFPHCFCQIDCNSSGTAQASRGMPPGSPETVQRCTTSPLFATATAGYSALHLVMR